MRNSAYVSMLSEAFPSVRDSRPGEIQESELPELRNLVVLDDKGEFRAEQSKLGVKSAIDWREIIVWREDTKEKVLQGEITKSLDKDEIINLQFTR